jgi:hypothetical protein
MKKYLKKAADSLPMFFGQGVGIVPASTVCG